MIELTVMSAAFAMGAAIPPKYCCSQVSPPLAWGDLPPGTQSIAVLCDDPDAPAGDWVHWVIFNLPADTTKLDEGVPKSAKLPNGAVQGVNDYGRNGYDGPCPPPGARHRYAFKVFALDTRLALGPTAEKSDLLKAIKGHVLAQGELTGTGKRP
ncbi:MAG: YbhB/YbcL family Raf kinase inhibitor-like protein [Kiritimatiellae bacterium]|nr:YbhB/YbcL family Raf kinase inhibitor-like protein [Kiritimatiellia bacterium]